MIVGSLEIQLRADLARLSRDMSGARQIVSDTSASMARAANAAKAALGGMAAALGGRELIDMTDQYTKFTAQLKLATTSQHEYAMAYADVKRISATAQAELGATGVLYARIANGTKELGIAQSQVARITEAVNLALTVSGATSSESASAMMQLSQAFSAGALRGEEFNAVNEAAPRLMKALADGLNVPVGALKKMAEEGKITSGTMAKVLGDQKLISDLREGAKQIQTVSGALTVLKNNVMELVGTKAQTSGFVDVTTKGILGLSKSIDALASGLATGAKIGAAYVAALVVAPAVFQVTATALGNLRLQLALARMEMASGATAASLLSTSLGGVAVSAQWASGALGKLAIASNVIFAAFAGWQIGKYLDEQFLQARVAGEVFAGATLEMWEHIKYGGTVAFDALTLAGRSLVQGLERMFASWFEFMAKGFRLVGFKVNGKEIADEVEAFAGRLRAAADAQGTFASRTAAASAEHERNLKIIRTVTQNRIDAAVAENLLSEATRNADAQGTAAAEGKSERTKEQERAAKREAAAYQTLITSIHEKLAANELEISGYDKLSDSQKMTVKLDAAIGTGKNKLSAEHVKEARALIAKVEAQERAIAAQQLAAKAAEAEAKRDADHYDSLRAGTAAIDDRIKQMEREIEMYGLSASAGVDAEKAKFEAKLAAGPATYAKLIALDEQIKKLGTLAKLARNKEALDANKQAAEQMAQQQRQMWESVERTAHDTFISIFDSGKSAFDRLTDALKNGLYELLYQMTVKQWLINIGATVTGSGGGIAGVAQAGSAIANGSSALSTISGLAGMANFGGSAIAGVGNLIGSSSISAFGAGFAGNTAGMAMTASETFASAGMAAEASAASFGASVSAALPYVGALIAAYAIYKKLDDSGTYHTGGASYADSTGSRTIRAESIGFAQTRTAAETEKMTAGLVQGVVGILDSTALTFGKTAGYTAATAFADDTSKDGAWGSLVIKNSAGTVLDWNQTRNSGWAPREFADGQKGQEQYLAEMSKSVRSALDGIGLPSWAKTMLNALGSDAGLDEMAQVVQEINKTQNALKGIGQTMSVFANLSDGMASKLIAAAGGIDALSNSAAAYYNAFYTESEKSARSLAQVQSVLASVGISMPATKAEFRALVEANMALGEAGAKTVATLLGVSGAFAQLKEAVGEVSTDLTSYRSAVTEAYNAEAEALQQTINKMGSFASSLRGLRDSAMLGNLSPLSPQQKYAEAKSQYEAVLAAARGGDETAQSKYQGAFTSFLEASRTVFASSDQYKRDFEFAQAATEEAARWAEAQVDVGQAQLDAIKASVVGIIDVKNEVMSLREALLQYNAAQAEQATPVATPAPAPIPYYPSEGRTNNAALEMKVDTLISELSGLRSDQQQQTGKQITGTAEAMYDAAVTIAKAVVQPWKFATDETRVLPE